MKATLSRNPHDLRTDDKYYNISVAYSSQGSHAGQLDFCN